MRCVPNVTAKLVGLSKSSDTTTESTGGGSARTASTATPLSRFMKVFFPEPQKLWKKQPSKETQCEKPSQSNLMERADDYGEDSDTRLRKFYEQAEPGRCYTLDEISKGMGVTSERVRQIEDMAIRKFRRRLGQILKSDGIEITDLLKND